MRKITIFEEVLLEEYDRANRRIALAEKELSELPKGVLTKKKIRGKEYTYLQWREGKKVKSKYVAKDKVPEIRKLLDLRKQRVEIINESIKSKKQTEKALGKGLIDEYFAAEGIS